jgi:hypothetical protein
MQRLCSTAASSAALLFALVVSATPVLADQTARLQQQQLGSSMQAVAIRLHGQAGQQQQQRAHKQGLQQDLQQDLPADNGEQLLVSTTAGSIRLGGRPENRILTAELSTPAPTPW